MKTKIKYTYLVSNSINLIWGVHLFNLPCKNVGCAFNLIAGIFLGLTIVMNLGLLAINSDSFKNQKVKTLIIFTLPSLITYLISLKLLKGFVFDAYIQIFWPNLTLTLLGFLLIRVWVKKPLTHR